MFSHLPDPWHPLLTHLGKKFDFGFNLIAKVLSADELY